MIDRIKGELVVFFAKPAVQSALRHAVFAALGVVTAAVAAGGASAIVPGVVVAAAAAAGRVLQLAVVAYFSGE